MLTGDSLPPGRAEPAEESSSGLLRSRVSACLHHHSGDSPLSRKPWKTNDAGNGPIMGGDVHTAAAVLASAFSLFTVGR